MPKAYKRPNYAVFGAFQIKSKNTHNIHLANSCCLADSLGRSRTVSGLPGFGARGLDRNENEAGASYPQNIPQDKKGVSKERRC